MLYKYTNRSVTSCRLVSLTNSSKDYILSCLWIFGRKIPMWRFFSFSVQYLQLAPPSFGTAKAAAWFAYIETSEIDCEAHFTEPFTLPDCLGWGRPRCFSASMLTSFMIRKLNYCQFFFIYDHNAPLKKESINRQPALFGCPILFTR